MNKNKSLLFYCFSCWKALYIGLSLLGWKCQWLNWCAESNFWWIFVAFYLNLKWQVLVPSSKKICKILYCWFQWLPGRPPQAIGELFENGRLDLSYEVDTQPGEKKEFKKHRALKIMRPTTELTGTYRCKVSSFVDEDFMQKKMIIYCKLLLTA